ncbi:MAG: LptF/LptG family permease [Bacteroidota bacterium]|nr:LptF/LptG family permease [Bacteroidota bacterium]
MFRVKRLHTFVLESFLPVFFMTFMISNFILVMQLLWRHIDQLVGKGIELSVFGEFYWYAALSLVPMSLPLAVLLASLMTFGNFGEKLELLSMKAAGISLFNIMKPLIVLMVFICVGAFYFQDKVMPDVQVKLTSLLISFKQKSPELSIPEGAFDSEINGVTIYVKKKNLEKNLMEDLMIYDFSQGYDNTAVTLAKYGKLRFTQDKKYLVFTLYNGEGFSNFANQQSVSAGIPYRRETFRKKEMVLDFDANFNRVNEAAISGLSFSKDTKHLRVIIDSLGGMLDSLDRKTQEEYVMTKYLGRNMERGHKLADLSSIPQVSSVKPFYPNVDSLLKSENRDTRLQTAERAKRRVNEIRSDLEYRQIAYANETYEYRRSSIEFHRKFTLSFACLIFFFIGAPLGAIIRKGGLGMPAVVSVFLFIFYYMVDITGYKFARDGVWNPVLGGWLSSAALLPLGLFLTYKSANDSAIMNSDAYAMFIKTWLNPKWLFRKLLGKQLPTIENYHDYQSQDD